MTESFELGDIQIRVIRKAIKNVHLTVHPPDGQVTMSVPQNSKLEVIRSYAISKLKWIKDKQNKLKAQPREEPRKFIDRESHYLWGHRYLLSVKEVQAKPKVSLDHKRINLFVRPGAELKKRAEVIHAWHKSLLHDFLPTVIRKWEKKLGVKVQNYFLQKMKTKWGSCTPATGNIRFNTELVKKPKDLIEYVVVHEMIHLLEASHNERFTGLMDKHWPNWRDARAELNELPIG